MQTTLYQNRKIAFRTEGDGFPLVLLHGFCEDHTVWDDMAPELNNFQIIRIDLPGFGKSEVGVESSVGYMANAVKSLLDHLGLQQCLMIGHSMGGYVSLAFAELYPQYLKGLGLFHSHPFEDSEEKKEDRRKSIQFIKTNGPIHYVKQLLPKLFAPAHLSSKRYVADRLIFQASQFPAEGIIGGLQAMIDRPDRTQVLRNSEVPVLFIIGEQDELVTMEQHLEQTHLPRLADVHILPKVGHMGLLTATITTAGIVQHFAEFCLSR